MVTVTDATCCGKYGIEDVFLWKEKDAQSYRLSFLLINAFYDTYLDFILNNI